MELLLLVILFWAGAALLTSVAFFAGAILALWLYGPSFYDGSEHSGARVWPRFRETLSAPLNDWLGRFYRFRVVDASATLGRAARDDPLLVAFHPHGIMAAGAGLSMLPAPFPLAQALGRPFAFGTRAPRLAIHRILFRVPVVRELLLWYGCVSASWDTMCEHLARGTVVGLVPGGVREMGPPVAPPSTRFLEHAYAHDVSVVPCYVAGEDEVCMIWRGEWRWVRAIRRFMHTLIHYPFPTLSLPRLLGWQPQLRVHVGGALRPAAHATLKQFCAAYAGELARLKAEAALPVV